MTTTPKLPEAQNQPITFKRAASDFVHSVDSLREFVSVVHGFLKSKGNEVIDSRAKELAPWAIAMSKLGAPGFEKLQIDETFLAKHFDGEVKFELTDRPEGGKSISILTSGPGEKAFEKAMEEFMRSQQRYAILYNNALVSLISSVEMLFANAFQLFFLKAPHVIGSKEKAFSLEELSLFKTIDDARAYLIESKVEKLMYGSFGDWIEYLRSHPKLTLSYLSKYELKLTEAFQRRHLYIHNGGRVNNQYLSKVDSSLTKGFKEGFELPTDMEYVMGLLEDFEAVGLLLVRELWSKLNPKDTDRGDFFMELIFDKLRESRWQLCEALTAECKADDHMDESHNVVCMLNHSLSIKRQGRWDEIREKVEKTDFDAKGMRYRLGWLSLCGNDKEFFILLPRAMKAGDVTYEEFLEFPIFEEMRTAPIGKEMIAKRSQLVTVSKNARAKRAKRSSHISKSNSH